MLQTELGFLLCTKCLRTVMYSVPGLVSLILFYPNVLVDCIQAEAALVYVIITRLYQ